MPLKRVAIVTETYSPEINGVANTLGYLVQGLLYNGLSVQIARPRQTGDETLQHQEREEHFTTQGLPIPGYAELKFGLPAKRRLLKSWKKRRPDAVYIATEGPLGWSAMRAAQALGIAVISGFHTNFHAYSRYYNLGWLEPVIFAYLRHFHNRTQATLVPTENQQNDLLAQGYRNVHVMRRGINKLLFHPEKRCDTLRQSLGVNEHTPICLYVGRIASEKNVTLIGKAYESVKAKFPEARFVFVGDGPQLGKLKTLYPDFIFAGMKKGEELAQYYASADIFLFPSLTDTFGNVVLEAMASKLAIVAFDQAAARELLMHQHSAMLVKDGKDTTFIAHLETLLAHTEDRRRLAGKAHAISEKLSWPSIVQEFMKHLERAISQLEESGNGEQNIKSV